MFFLPLGSMRGQLQLVGHDLGQLFQRDFDFEHVCPGIAAGLARPSLLAISRGDRRTFFAFALADAAATVLAVAEVGHVQRRERDADQIATLAADHLAVGHVLAQVLPDLAAHDLLESRIIVLDLHSHGRPLDGSGWIRPPHPAPPNRSAGQARGAWSSRRGGPSPCYPRDIPVPCESFIFGRSR